VLNFFNKKNRINNSTFSSFWKKSPKFFFIKKKNWFLSTWDRYPSKSSHVIFFKCWSHVHFWTYQSHLSRVIGLGRARKNVIPPPLMLINLAIFLNFFPSNYGYWNLQKHMILLFNFFYYIAMILTLSYLKKSFSTFGYSAWNNVYKFWQFFLHFFFPLIMDIENLKKHMILALLM